MTVAAFGAEGEAIGEVVFNTSMTGYQEILTDPSYEGQLVAMTYPEIGNVGINPEDVESRRPFMKGFIVKDYTAQPSNWRATQPLHEYMKANGIVGIQGIDTRSLVRHLRDHGAQEGIISTLSDNRRGAGRQGQEVHRVWSASTWCAQVTCEEAYDWNQGMWRLEGRLQTARALPRRCESAKAKALSAAPRIFRRRL